MASTSCSQTSDHTCTEDEGQVLGSGLQRTPDQGENGGKEDSIDTANAISDPSTNETADNSSEIILCHGTC